MILRARVLLPVSQPPIDDGAVTLSGNRIVSVGRWADVASVARGQAMDLGETILLPGLVNAHCHLDYTDMAGQLPPPRRFPDWIKGIMALKANWSYADFAQSWLKGAKMLLRTGVTTVADIEAVPELIPDMWSATPLRVFSFRELINLRHPTPEEVVGAAVNQWSSLPAGRGSAGLSPHAPYTTTSELLRVAAQAARSRNWRLTTHVAESEAEFEMFMYRHGPLYDWLKNQRDMSDCGLGSPVQHLERCGYLDENFLAAHVNYLWRNDAALLGQRKISVAHCPRSHAYFRHLLFPRGELAAAGVNLCLGTDSLASLLKVRGQLPELNLFSEMQALIANAPDVPPPTVLRMATINGARALGKSGDLGELSPHALADLIAIPFTGPMAAVYEAAVHHSGDVAASMIDGVWAIEPQAG